MNSVEGHCGEPKPRAKRGGKRSNLDHFAGLPRRARALLAMTDRPCFSIEYLIHKRGQGHLMNSFEGHCERSEAISIIRGKC